MFLGILSRYRIENDQVFDWMIPKKDRPKYLKEIKRKFKQSVYSESLLGESNSGMYGNQDKYSISDSVS